MDLARTIEQMERSARSIEALCRSQTFPADWKPTPDRWSLLEIVAHLADEEREDFRPRLDRTLHEPERDWDPIDPAGWVTSRDYASRDLETELNAYLEERARSVEWLRSLDAPDWSAARTHPVAGTLHAGDLLAAWVNHDLLHLRQITRLQFERVEAEAGRYHSEYAGEWPDAR